MSASTTSTTRSRLVPMRPRDPGEPGRTASSLELFFDLVFVVAVSIAAVQLHHALTDDHVLPGLLSYAFVFFAIWWAWVNFTWFATSFDTDITAGKLVGEKEQQVLAGVPVGRKGRPADVADLITYLCREESGYITGATYDVNGGSHIH